MDFIQIFKPSKNTVWTSNFVSAEIVHCFTRYMGGQMLMFVDKVGGWGWTNADVSKKSYPRKKNGMGFF